jgi:hypothetical protein
MQDSRNIVVHTSAAGADKISHLLAVYYFTGVVDDILDEKKLATEEATNLKSMLYSEDRDNYEIAVMAINQIRYGHSI